MNITNLIKYVQDTRRFGHTYIHAAVRRATHGWEGLLGTLDGRPVRVTYCGWGRSLQTATGHKYKAHARWEDTGKPVASKLLAKISAV